MDGNDWILLAVVIGTFILFTTIVICGTIAI